MRKQFSGTVLLAAAVAGIAAAATGAQPGLAASPQTWRAQLATDPTGAVGLAASTLLWLLLGLIALGVTATVLGRLPGAAGSCCDALSERLLPAAMRRAVHLMIGVTVGVTVLAPAGAWAADGAAARPGVSIGVSAPAASLPNPLPSLGEPGGPVTMPTLSAPPPQVAPTPVGTPETTVPTVAPDAPTPDAPTPGVSMSAAPTGGSPTPSAPTQGGPTPGRPTPGRPTPGSPTPGSPTPGSPTPGSATPGAGGTSTPGAPAPLAPTDGTPTALPGAGATGAGPPPTVAAPAAPPASPLPTRPPAAKPQEPQAVPPAAAVPPGMDPTMAGALGGTSAATVSVVPGDSLWVLAARDLARRDGGAVPGDAAIAAEWPRWWAANRAAIGTDPNLLTPGQRLAPPA